MKTTDKPGLQDFHIDGVKHISPSDALEAIKNREAVMLDVRELNEVMKERIPLDRVLNHPMSVIEDRLPYISKDQNIIVACPGGVRSVKVASLLIAHGYPNIASLDGGLMAWKAMGLPYESSLSSCCCSCSSETAVTPFASSPSKSNSKDLDYKSLKPII
jgi:rhodanese-related sulfurtransferase